ncbi:MAG: FG-GAP-like repeat-containing protein [Vicinamibacteria bacterium]
MARRTWIMSALVAAGLLAAQHVLAVEKASEQVSSFYGSFSQSVPIEVPPFRGLEPRIALSYSSEGRNGFAGVGWSVSGFSTVQRVNAGLGSPRFDANDVYLLDGQELYPCQVGSVSPSCTTGGTHSTKIESYQRIKFEPGPNTWTVWDKRGTRTLLSPTITVPANAYVPGGTLRWGVSSRVDTDNNTVAYTWVSQDGDSYPSTAAYNGYEVAFFKEARPDWLSAASATVLGETRYRLRSVIVWSPGVSHIRGYKLTYSTSALTGRSLLASVQQYGKDLVHSAGLLTGGTTLPAQTFTYQNDAIGKSFADWGTPPTIPTYTTGVTWSNHVNTAATGTGSSLIKNGGSAGTWDAGADSTYAIASGTGYVEWLASAPGSGGKAAGLSFGNTDVSPADIDFAFYELDHGVLQAVQNGILKFNSARATNDVLRIEVVSGVVYWKKNGVTLYQTPTAVATYPLRVDASIAGVGSTINSAVLSGSLVNVNAWCQAILYSGDFNGDGRTDQLCYTSLSGGISRVSLSSASGLQPPTTWTTGGLTSPVFADYNNDGKTDVARYDVLASQFSVALSTGSAFGGWTVWGTIAGVSPGGATVQCNGAVAVGSGDFNGDGVTDVYCHQFGTNLQFVGLSTGTAFTSSVFSQYGCDTNGDEALGAIDFDGDGKDDWFCIGSDNDLLAVFPSTGSTFLYPAHGSLSFCSGNQYVLGDLNGDGRTDATCLGNGSVALSMGRSFLTVGSYGAWCSGGQAFAADVDGDGASEVVCNNTGMGATDIQVRKWKGAGQSPALGAAETWRANWCGGLVTGGDFNGDSKSDLYCMSTTAPAIAGTGGVKADLMTASANGLGGTLQVGYTPSSAYAHTNNPPVKQVVSSLTALDGRGGADTTTFQYANGLMDRKERVFLGFGYARKNLPCLAGEAACPFTETGFYQTLASAGSPQIVVQRSGAGNILAMQTFVQTTNGSTIPRKSLLTTETRYTYDEGGCASSPCAGERVTQVTHQYDAYANRTQSAFAGVVGPTGDERSTTWTYFPNTTGYVVGALAKEERFSAGGSLLAATRYRYDLQGTWNFAPTLGHVTETERWYAEQSRWTIASTRYDSWGNVTSTTDASGRQTNTSYDAARHIYPETTSYPAAPTESETTLWDAVCGVPTQRTDANAQVTTFEYDPLCRKTRTNHPLSGFEAISYRDFGDPALQRIAVETPPGMTGGPNVFRTTHFDGRGRKFRTVSKGPSAAEVIVTERTFNQRGLLASEIAPYYATDGPVATTLHSYDQLDRLKETEHADGNSATRSYGKASVVTVDEAGKEVRTFTDAYGNVVQKQEVLSGNLLGTDYIFDALDRMTGLEDPLNVPWSWTYDTLGRVASKTDPDSGVRTYLFDDEGRTTRETDAKLDYANFTYDPRGRLATRQTYNAGGTLQSSVTWTYGEPRASYFNVGRLTTITGPGTTLLKRDYDAAGRTLRSRRTLDAVEYTSSKTFDPAGRVKSLTWPDSDAINPITYDEAGRAFSVSAFISGVLWDASGRPTQQTNANGTLTEWTYDADRGFLESLVTTGPAGKLQGLDYTTGPSGRVLEVASLVASESWTYTYDDIYRLTAADNVTGTADDQTWTYDFGSRITNNSRVGTYTYPAFPTSPRPHAPLTAGPNSYTYDANGARLTGAGLSLTWDSSRRLSGANVNSFVYGAEGERLKKSNSLTATRYPLGDDYEVTAAAVTKYIRIPGLGLIGKRVTTPGGTSNFWLHRDHLGSIQAVSNASGIEVLRRKYRSFGETLAQAGSHTESRGWIDQRQDGETGLTFLHARYYDSPLNLFVSPDEFSPVLPGVGLNRYAYGLGDPINGTDRNGNANEPVGCVTRLRTHMGNSGYASFFGYALAGAQALDENGQPLPPAQNPWVSPQVPPQGWPGGNPANPAEGGPTNPDWVPPSGNWATPVASTCGLRIQDGRLEMGLFQTEGSGPYQRNRGIDFILNAMHNAHAVRRPPPPPPPGPRGPKPPQNGEPLQSPRQTPRDLPDPVDDPTSGPREWTFRGEPRPIPPGPWGGPGRPGRVGVSGSQAGQVYSGATAGSPEPAYDGDAVCGEMCLVAEPPGIQ